MVPISQVFDCRGCSTMFDHAQNLAGIRSLQEDDADPSTIAHLPLVKHLGSHRFTRQEYIAAHTLWSGKSCRGERS